MCRSIVSLRDVDDLSPSEVEAAARQFVRKVSGTKAKTPSRANQEAFDRAIAEIAGATSRLLDAWTTPGHHSARHHHSARQEAADRPHLRPAAGSGA